MDKNSNLFFDFTVRGILLELRKYLLIIIMLAFATFLTTTAIGKITYKPVYESHATLAITARGREEYNYLSMTSSMANVFSDVFESEALQRQISEAVGREIDGKITSSNISETNMINLVSTSSDPAGAYLYLKMALENYDEVSKYVFSDALLNVVQEPSVPTAPVNTSPFIRYRLLITFVVVAIVVAFVLVNYFMRFTIKSITGAEKLLDGEILGVLNVEKQRQLANKGLKKKNKNNENMPLLLTSSLLSMDFSERMRMLAYSVERSMKKKNQKRIVVTSVLEHEGKTTFSFNLAASLAERGNKVLLIDGDLLRATIFNMFKKKKEGNCSVTDVLQKKVDWKQAIRVDEKSRVRILFQESAVTDTNVYLDVDFMNKLTEEMSNYFDYVIVDCPPITVSNDAEVWMQVVDTGLIVVRQDWSDVRVINDTVDLIWQNCGDFTGFALNAFSDYENASLTKGG